MQLYSFFIMHDARGLRNGCSADTALRSSNENERFVDSLIHLTHDEVGAADLISLLITAAPTSSCGLRSFEVRQSTPASRPSLASDRSRIVCVADGRHLACQEGGRMGEHEKEGEWGALGA